MEQKEALELNTLCDKTVSDYLGMSCTVSVVLPNMLDIVFNDCSRIIWDITDNVPHYISYIGVYNDLVSKFYKIEKCVDNNRDDFVRLIWLYDHRDELGLRVVITNV